MNAPSCPAPSDITLLYHDDALLVLNKPAGLLSVPGRGVDKQDCVSARVQAQFPDALVVHRLDMATSGLMLMARGADAQRAVNHSFADGKVEKRYLALVAGLLEADELWRTIDLPIAVDWPRRPLRMINADGKASQTRWRCIAQYAQGQSSRVELEPLTGRSHQLRVHMQAIGHPILGDALYANAQVQAMAPRLLLHACALSLLHPYTGMRMRWECPAQF
jgi:tRNA pseudouridine32 synthase/23S rRNA pseudouridine746 synthase